MFSNDDQSGLFTFLVGMIVLVMAGVGLSIVIDKRLKFSSGSNEREELMRVQAAEYKELKDRCETKQAILDRLSGEAKSSASNNLEVAVSLKISDQRRSELKQRKQVLKDDLAALEEKFKTYRAEYRRKVRISAIGEKLGDISISGGREYRDCTVTKVTDVGLEVRHEHGFARIQAPDLDRTIHDRFQWDDEERRKRLSEEEALVDRIAGGPEKVVPPSGRGHRHRPKNLEQAGKNKDREELKARRLQVTAWKTKVSNLRSEKRSATSQASMGNSSVPGSLETWKTKAARLGVDLSKASGELAVARARLAEISPNDILLFDHHDDRD